MGLALTSRQPRRSHYAKQNERSIAHPGSQHPDEDEDRWVQLHAPRDQVGMAGGDVLAVLLCARRAAPPTGVAYDKGRYHT